MKKLFPLLFLACMFTFAACDSDKDEITEISEKYILKSVTYSLEEDDGKTQESFNLPTYGRINPKNENVKWTFDLLSDMSQSESNFVSNDKNAFFLSSEIPVVIRTPYFLLDKKMVDDKKITLVSTDLPFAASTKMESTDIEVSGLPLGPKAPYSAEPQPLIPSVIYTMDLTIPAGKKLVVTGKAQKIKFQVTYTAVLIGEVTGTEVIVKGKWIGTEIGSPTVVISEEPIVSE